MLCFALSCSLRSLCFLQFFTSFPLSLFFYSVCISIVFRCFVVYSFIDGRPCSIVLPGIYSYFWVKPKVSTAKDHQSIAPIRVLEAEAEGCVSCGSGPEIDRLQYTDHNHHYHESVHSVAFNLKASLP